MLASEMRLMPMISIEDEWKYLVNETFIGEKCIIPLLTQVLQSELVLHLGLKNEIERQLSEERNHVRIYYKHVGPEKLLGSQYDKLLFDLISSIASPTLKLFALQGMLEGIALGALEYRLKYWVGSPSQTSDKQVKTDEEGHTTLSYPFFTDLIRLEGPIAEDSFRATSKEVNQVFTRSFTGAILKQYVNEVGTGTNWTNDDFEATPAMHNFKKQSAQTISKNRSAFLIKYFEASKSV